MFFSNPHWIALFLTAFMVILPVPGTARSGLPGAAGYQVPYADAYTDMEPGEGNADGSFNTEDGRDGELAPGDGDRGGDFVDPDHGGGEIEPGDDKRRGDFSF